MISKIYDLVNLLKDVRDKFQAKVIDVEEKRKLELKILDDSYIKGTEIYRDREQQIELDYNTALMNVRKWAAEKAGEGMEDLRELERQRAERIDEETLKKLSALENIPLTQGELQVLLNKYGKTQYWTQRIIGNLAEKNGISQSALHLESPLDIKLHVIQQLDDQLEKMLVHFTTDSKVLERNPEAKNARWLYLADSVLNNAVKIYTNNLQEASQIDAVTRAYHQIRATSGQMQKGVLIAHTLRNLHDEDTQNDFLYRLSTDDGISSAAFEVAGIANEMAAWQGGKASRYAAAKEIMGRLQTEPDAERITEKLRAYMADVDNGRQQENEFIGKMLVGLYKHNSAIGVAIQGLDNTERDALLHNAGQHNVVQPGAAQE